MKNITIFLSALALLVFSQTVNADQTIAMKSDKGSIEFKAKGPLVRVTGTGPGAAGTLAVKDGLASGVLSLNLKTLDTGISLRDDHMKNKYLEVSKPGFDVAVLTLKDVQLPKALKGKAKFKGLLKLHGIEKPVNGTVKIKGVKKGVAKIDANFKIKFSDYKIPLPSFKLVSLGEKITISVKSSALVEESKNI